jgi:regulator of cell morphogenesis and NO signaling
MKIDGKLRIAELAAGLPGAMALFESLGIDYACAGDRSLDDAAHAEGIAPEVVIANLRRLKSAGRAESWSDRPLADLTHYLVEQHHHFVREELARIAIRLADLCSAPGGAHSDLKSLRAAFTRLSETILPHLHHEEEQVFPVIEALEKTWQSNEPLAGSYADLIPTLQQLAGEHGVIAAELRTMRDLRFRLADSNDLLPRCSPTLEDVAKLEAHLHECMFLENCILFPRAGALVEQAGEPGGSAHTLP